MSDLIFFYLLILSRAISDHHLVLKTFKKICKMVLKNDDTFLEFVALQWVKNLLSYFKKKREKKKRSLDQNRLF